MNPTVVHHRNKGTEMLGLLFFAFAALLVLCLASYDAWDPSFNVEIRNGQSPAYHNYIGRFGAYCADLLLQIFGFSAFLLVFPLCLLGWSSWQGRFDQSLLLKLLGFALFLVALNPFLEIVPLFPAAEANFRSGGVLGFIFSRFLIDNFNQQGSIILLTTLAALSLVLSTNLSLSRLIVWAVSLPGSLIRSLWSRRSAPGAQKPAAPPSPSPARAKAPAAEKQPESETRPASAKATAATKTAEKSIPVIPLSPPSPEEKPKPAPVTPVSTSAQPLIAETAFTSEAARPAGKASVKPEGIRLEKILLPSTAVLEKAPEKSGINEGVLMEIARRLQEKCAEFGVLGNVTQIHPGPIVTTFEFKPDSGIKYSRVVSLVDDLCLGLQAESIRIDRIPGKSTVGIEVPNPIRDTIFLREIIESEKFRESKSKLTLALGKTIHGEPYITDLARMPHLLVAGATGAGKSVGINAMITSILYKASPEEVKFILVDPKRLELGMYADIPHLLTPIVTDPKRAASVLDWTVREMENRYKRLANYGVRNIEQFNHLVKSAQKDSVFAGDESDQPLPFIVLIIDELADLMMTTGREVEEAITRLAQMARAVGIHLILATQRPSVDVITGLIKANFPCRLSYRVSQKIDSRTIIDTNGAEKLLVHGDMLFLPPGTSRLWRIHGAYISEKETQKIADFLKKQAAPLYDESIEKHCQSTTVSDGPEEMDEDDPLYEEAVRVVVEQGQAATSSLQRRLKVGYGRAARLLDMMERDGIVGPPNGSKAREVLRPPDYFREIDQRL